MGPLFHSILADELARDRERLLRRAEARRLWSPVAAPRDPVTLRLDTVRDDKALADLATLAGIHPAPRGRHVVAEVDGHIVAALPINGGRPYADPFRRTAHLLPLLELRAGQISGAPKPRRRRFRPLRWARA